LQCKRNTEAHDVRVYTTTGVYGTAHQYLFQTQKKLLFLGKDIYTCD
jgi:hypothetical protein